MPRKRKNSTESFADWMARVDHQVENAARKIKTGPRTPARPLIQNGSMPLAVFEGATLSLRVFHFTLHTTGSLAVQSEIVRAAASPYVPRVLNNSPANIASAARRPSAPGDSGSFARRPGGARASSRADPSAMLSCDGLARFGRGGARTSSSSQEIFLPNTACARVRSPSTCPDSISKYCPLSEPTNSPLSKITAWRIA
jgi:hypothetical protein